MDDRACSALGVVSVALGMTRAAVVAMESLINGVSYVVGAGVTMGAFDAWNG